MAAISCTVNSGGGADYVSLSAAEAGMQATYANLVGDGNTITFNCSGGVDANACTIDGWTTDATHFITVNVAKANRHTSVRGTGYRIVINANNGCCLNIADPYTRVIGVALSNGNTDGNYVRGLIASVTCLIDSCLVYDCADNGTGLGIYCNTSSVTYTIVNTIVYNSRANIIIENGTGYIYNCTSLNGQWGIYQGGTVYAKNVYSGGNSSADYQGTITTTTCYSSDATGDTQTSIANCRFTSAVTGREDIHVTPGSSLIEVGTDLHVDATYPFNTDAFDNNIPNGSWDVGANYHTAPYTVTIGNNTGDTYSGVEDTTIVESHPTYNYGAYVLLATRATNNYKNIILISASGLSNIPATSTVVAASVSIDHIDLALTDTLVLRGLLRNWGEGSKDAAAAEAGESSYNCYSYPNTWTTAGALGDGSDRDSDSCGSISLNGSYGFKTSSNINSIVQKWVDGTRSNYGIQITATREDSTEFSYWSNVFSDGYRPYFSVTYTESGGTVYKKGILFRRAV